MCFPPRGEPCPHPSDPGRRRLWNEPRRHDEIPVVKGEHSSEDGRERVLLFNLSGHGFLDINAYASV